MDDPQRHDHLESNRRVFANSLWNRRIRERAERFQSFYEVALLTVLNALRRVASLKANRLEKTTSRV